MDNYLEAKPDFIDETQDEDTKKIFYYVIEWFILYSTLLHYTGKIIN